MIRSRINYWSCSKFANWIRGENKPTALTSEEWEEWREENKSKRPIRFWIAEELLDKIQDLFCFPSDIWKEIGYYYDNRFVSKTHYLKTGLQPGKYHELDERIMHGLFNELVEFVEVEQARINHLCSKEKNFKFKNGRCPEAGIDYLNWSMGLVYDESSGIQKSDKNYGRPLPQAETAKKIFEIYNWWLNERPNRPDPMEASGWANYCDNKKDYTEKQASSFLKKLDKIEQEYHKEDEEMMIDLIKIRGSLWT